ncbi:MAG: tripartite tricarboxylate transporter substrate binding protein [Burkholderiales bacterium]
MKRFVTTLALLIAVPAAAQNYPSRPIRMMVPAAAAGVTDIAARVLTPRLSEALGQSVVVDNRAGAGGIIGTDIVAKAAPDGYTLMTAFDSFTSNPYVFKKIPYDTLKDFAPISLLIRGPQIFVATPKLGAKSFSEFVAIAKSKPGTIRYATAGPATSSRLSVELFKAISKLDGTTIFFKGGGPALNDLLGGHVDVMIASAGLVLSHAKSGRLHALAVSSKNRTPLAPGVPSISEFYPQFEAQSWVGMLAPAATPRAIIQRLNTEVNKALADPDVKERFNTLGYEIAGGSPDQFGEWLRTESVKWGKVIRDNNITAE